MKMSLAKLIAFALFGMGTTTPTHATPLEGRRQVPTQSFAWERSAAMASSAALLGSPATNAKQFRVDGSPPDLYMAAWIPAPASPSFDAQPARAVMQTPAALGSHEIPEPGPISAGISTFALALFFFLRRRA